MPKKASIRVASDVAEEIAKHASLKLCDEIIANGLKATIAACLATGTPGALAALAPVLTLVSLKAWKAWREDEDDAAIRDELTQSKALLEQVARDQAGANDKLADLVEHRSWVSARLPGYEKDELSERVAARLISDLKREVLATIERPAAAIDRRFSLPAAPQVFKGRREELEELAGQASGGATISAVRGMGGIGKTAFALVLAHGIKDAYSDGQVFVDMQGTGKQPLGPIEAMGRVVQAFEPGKGAPESLEEAERDYAAALTGKRVLLLFDNAKDKASVDGLQPPPGCLMLVTSRDRFVLPGLATIDLEVLGEADAVALLRELCERLNEDDAKAVADKCGCLPLALELAGTALAERDTLSVEDYLGRLEGNRLKTLDRDATDESRTVTAAIRTSEELLAEEHPELAERWRTLHVFAGGFTASAVAAVWGHREDIDDPDAWDTPSDDATLDDLHELRTRSMVEYDDERFRLHDLVRDYAREACLPERSDAAGQRHARLYLSCLSLASRAHKSDNDDTIAGLQLYDLERDNIDAGYTWALNLFKARPSNVIAAVLVDRYAGRADILAIRQPTATHEAWLRSGLAAAECQNDSSRIAMHAGHLGLILHTRGDLDGAESMQRRSLALNTQLGKHEAVAANYGNLGAIMTTRSDLDASEAMYRRSVAIYKELQNESGIATQYGNLSVILRTRGDLAGAETLLHQSIAICEKIDELSELSHHYGNLGLIKKDQGDLDGADIMFHKSLSIYKRLGRRDGMAKSLGNLGMVASARGDINGAMALYRESFAINEELGRREGMALQYGNIGSLLLRQGDLNGAESMLHKSLIINQALGRQEGVAIQLANLGALAEQRGSTAEAAKRWTLARDLFAEIGAEPMRARVQGWLDDLDS